MVGQPSFSLALCPLAAGFVLVFNSELIAHYCEACINRNFIRKERNLRLPTSSCSPDPLSFSPSVSGMIFLTLSVYLTADLSGHDWGATFSGKPSHPCCQGWLFPLIQSTQASVIFTEHLPMSISFSLCFPYTPPHSTPVGCDFCLGYFLLKYVSCFGVVCTDYCTYM